MTKNKQPSHFCPEPGRYERQGFPEAIYSPGKTKEQIVSIAAQLLKGNGPVIATRADEKVFKALKKRFPASRYYKTARITHILQRPVRPPRARSSGRFLCVITAGTTDSAVAEEAAVVAELLGCAVERIYDVGVAGVHRLLSHQDILLKAQCVIVCAGMEGALASVVGGIVRCPVIGVPTSVGYGVSFQGVAPLLTMLNSCAANVCAVNIDDGFGAGIIGNLIVNSHR